MNKLSVAAPYCEVADVKEVLRIPDDISLSDVELGRCVTSADRMLRSWAKVAGLVIPDVVPEDIVEASKYVAAWFFGIHGDPPVNKQDLYDLGKSFFDSWVAGANAPYVGSV